MNSHQHPVYAAAQAFHAAFRSVEVSPSYAELAKLGTPEQRAEAVRVAAHKMIAPLLAHRIITEYAELQPEFAKLRANLIEWHGKLADDAAHNTEHGWESVKDLYKHPEDVVGRRGQMWDMLLDLCTHDLMKQGPRLIAWVKLIFGQDFPLFPESLAKMAVSFFVDALQAEQAKAAQTA